jgi:hypothetical protein
VLTSEFQLQSSDALGNASASCLYAYAINITPSSIISLGGVLYSSLILSGVIWLQRGIIVPVSDTYK